MRSRFPNERITTSLGITAHGLAKVESAPQPENRNHWRPASHSRTTKPQTVGRAILHLIDELAGGLIDQLEMNSLIIPVSECLILPVSRSEGTVLAASRE